MINNAIECWVDARDKHSAYFDEFVTKKLKYYNSHLTTEVYDFIIFNLDAIRDGKEEDFRKIQTNFENIFSLIPLENRELVDSAIRKIFDYDTFSKKRKRRWCAYHLCSALSFKTCPYCNLSYEITEWEDGYGVIRPALDHFFDKEKYPLFSISIGNFVPSCHHCNSTFKGGADFFKFPHLNPLYQTESINILLDIDILKARYDLAQFDTANIRLDFDSKLDRNINSVNTFKIQKRYQGLIMEVRDIARSIVEYSTSGKNDAASLGWATRHVDRINYRDRVFGKMILDMQSEYM